MKIGQSVDIHRLVENRKLILAGVKIPYSLGLLGHSDADALSHAIAEAIIGALSLGDLGSHFPDDDKKNQDRCSLEILKEVYLLMDSLGYKIGNIDSLIMIEEPKMAPYIALMIDNIAESLNCSTNVVNVKATRGEGLGFVGEKKGVVALATVLLKGKEDD